MYYTNIPVVHLRMVKEREIEYENRKMDSPKKAADLIRPFLDGVDRECMIVCGLNNKMKLAIILFHNHPSGEPEPSEEDIAATIRIRDAGELLEIALKDHIILGDNGKNYSFLENKEHWEDRYVN